MLFAFVCQCINAVLAFWNNNWFAGIAWIFAAALQLWAYDATKRIEQ